jgi:uncharacterized protein
MSIVAAAPVFQGLDPVSSIVKHLASGGRLDVRCPQTQQSLVHWLLYVLDVASIPRSLKMLKRLLALGIDVNLRDDEGSTALIMACEPEYKDHCKALLDAGADADLARTGEQAIHVAFYKGLRTHIRLLIDAGADINVTADCKDEPSGFNVRTGEGGTCLMRAAGGNRVELFPMLFAAGADVNYVSGTGNRRATALTVAAKLNATTAFNALLKAGADPGKEANFVALCYGANNNNMHIVRTMLAAGAPIDYTIGESIVALGRAIMQRHTKMVKFLIEQGADVNKAIIPKQGGSSMGVMPSTPLEYACVKSNVWSAAENEFVDKLVNLDVLKLLLKAGVNVNAANKNGYTALHNLLQRPVAPVEALQAVIQHGANINATDVSGRTPLMMCLNEHTDTALPMQHIAALIRAGADCNTANSLGVTPLQWFAAVPDGKIPLLKLLLRGGADVAHTVPADDRTALYDAVSSSNVEAVQLLLAAGSSVQHRENMHMTPLFMVRSLPVLSLLLAAGADVQARSFNGHNALHWVCAQTHPKPTAAIVCGLIRAGVDLTARSNGPNGYTPAQVAKYQGHTLIAQLLDRAERDYRSQN